VTESKEIDVHSNVCLRAVCLQVVLQPKITAYLAPEGEWGG